MSANPPDFVNWREEFISQERGSRIAHYYLEDSAGAAHLAVIGTERSLRHMLYVVSQDFCRKFGSDELGASCLKWRSRREVVEWLTSFLRSKSCTQKLSKYGFECTLDGEVELSQYNANGTYMCKQLNKGNNSEIIWSGVSWTCGKQLRHYESFCRDGIKINVCSFVLVMSEEENHYLAYLEDMYEDKKGQKKVKVRWFHQNQEFAWTIPAPRPHPKEVFITPYSQVISAECVDDIATVLTPEHYEKCLGLAPSTSRMSLCFRQYSKNKFKHFDLRTLRGYFSQAILSSLDDSTLSEKGMEKSGCSIIKRHSGPRRIRFVKGHKRFLIDRLSTKVSGHSGHITLRPECKGLRHDAPSTRPLSVKFLGPRNFIAPPYEVGEKIELLCQDSGIRGCWFKCTVLQSSHKRLKVRYDDVQSVDGCENLEEWIPAFKPAVPDRLGMRCTGRLTIRPCPTSIYLVNNVNIQRGMAVDARWSDGWWEGVVVGMDNDENDNLQVYLPGEYLFLTFNLKDLRISKDWVGNRWIDINAKPEVLSAMCLVSLASKLTACSIIPRGTEFGTTAMLDQHIIGEQVELKTDMPFANNVTPMTKAALKMEKPINTKKRQRDDINAGGDDNHEIPLGVDGS